MSRSGPIGQLGMKPPARRQSPDEQMPAQPITQPSPHWPPPYSDAPTQRGHSQAPAQGYYFPQPDADGDVAHGHAPQAPLPFNRFPPVPEADAGRGFAPQASAHQLPFNRFPPTPADPDPNYGYAPQDSEPQQPPFSFPHAAPPPQPGSAGPPWSQQAGHQGGHQVSQQADPRGFDLGNYMSAPGQGYAQADAGHFQPQQQHEPPPFAAPQGYGETDAEFDEALAEDEEEPRHGRRGLMIVAALVGAIGLGGGMAYGYKTFFPSRTGPAPLIKDTQGPSKSKPEIADGRGFPHTDKKLLNRLGDEAAAPGAAAAAPPSAADAPEDRAGDDPNSPRRVRTIPITPGGPQPVPGMVVSAPPGPSGPPSMVSVPGVALNMGPPPRAQQLPPQAPPSAARVQLPAPMPPVRPAQQPPVRVASAGSMPPAAAAEPAAPVRRAPVATQAAPEKAPVPKTRVATAAPAATASSGAGFVAVLSSQKSRMDALKIFANMQEKYGEVLSSRTPDVQEANLGEKGVWYRLVVGPPGSRDAAAGVCTQLKTAGFAGCWVTSY